MKIIDLFSGIGGFALGFQRAGYQFTEHYFSEIDKKAIANYKYNFPHARNLGDITTLQPADIAGADIITFGSPCQDFSLAGKRTGLKGNKSSLIQHAIALITHVRPSIFTDLNNNCLIQNGYFPKIASGFTLSAILQDEVSQEYFLSERMINYLKERQGKKIGNVQVSKLHLHEQ